MSCKQNTATNDGAAKESARGACGVSKELRWFGERAGLRVFSTEKEKKSRSCKSRVAQIYRGEFAESPRCLQGLP